MTASAGFAPPVHRERLARAASAAAQRDLDALLITPSPDYAYLLGYHAPELERLTCLIVRADGVPALIVPRLEAPLARHELGDLVETVELVAWDETDDPIALARTLLPGVVRVGVQDKMWAAFVLRLRAALGPTELVEAGPAMSALRRVKSAEELDRLRGAAEAADAAMLEVLAEPLEGRTEAEVSRRIRDGLLLAGHESADFAIVAAGPNSASPHHVPGDRTIERGDALVLDIGGTRAGYCSDTTRTAFVGEPNPEFAELHAVLRAAQAAACEAVRPGIPCSEIDTVARRTIAAAGYGDAFIHRTGHGIGMETHEEPYIVEFNAELLEAGHAFSVEPGIYIPDRWGARIEDIVICTESSGQRLNVTSTELYVVD